MAEILINDIEPLDQYTAAGGELGFDYSFPIFDDDDLVVLQITDASVVTTLIKGTDYTVSGVGLADGGTMTFDVGVYPTGAQADYRYVLYRDLAVARLTDFLTGGDFKAVTVNRELDKIIMMLQQLEVELKRSVGLQKSDAEGQIKFDIQTALERSDKFLSFDANGNILKASVEAGDIENAAANAAVASAQALLAEGYKDDAAISAAEAQAALETINPADVVNITFADSPYTLDASDISNILAVDTSGGNVVINADAGLVEPFSFILTKETGDANTVTINLGGTDEFFDGTTSKILDTITGASFTLDTSGTPSVWNYIAFGGADGVDGVDGADVALETQIAATDATIDFVTGIDATYDKYFFEILGVVPSAAGYAQLQMLTSTDGGTTFDNGASDYRDVKHTTNEYGTIGGGGSSGGRSVIELVDRMGSDTTEIGDVRVSLLRPASLERTIIEVDASYFNYVDYLVRHTGAGARVATTAVNAVRFKFDSGTILKGKFTLYGRSGA